MTDKPVLTTFGNPTPLDIQKYKRYLPTAFDESLSLLEKVNMVIDSENNIIETMNDVVTQVNSVQMWALGDGLQQDVNNKLNEMSNDGTLANVINIGIIGSLTDLKTTKTDNLVDAINDNHYQVTESTGYGVISGLDINAQATPNMSVLINAGTIHLANGKRFVLPETNSFAITTADSLQNRTDIIYVSGEGVISYITGALGSGVPTTPTDGFKLAEITVNAGVTSIISSDIKDTRLMKHNNNDLNTLLTDIAINVQRYSYVGLNGIKDDADRINLAIQNSSRVYCPAGTYNIPSNKHILPVSNTEIFGVKGKTIFKKDSSGSGTYDTILDILSPYTTPDDSLKNIKIHGIIFQDSVDTLHFSQHIHTLAVHGVDGLDIFDCQFIGFRGDGIELGVETTEQPDTVEHRRNSNVKIHDNIFDGINLDNRNGFSIISGDNVKFFNNIIRNTSRSDMPGAIDIEPNPYPVYTIKDIEIYGNTLVNIGGNVSAISVTVDSSISPNNIKIHDNILRSVYRNFHVSVDSADASNISIYDNDCQTTTSLGLYLVGNINKLSFENNIMLDIHGMGFVLGSSSATTEDLTLKQSTINNNIVQNTGAYPIIRSRKLDTVTIHDNVLMGDTTDVFMQFGYDVGASTLNTRMDDNIFELTNTPTNIITSSGTFDLSTNTFERNASNKPLTASDKLFALSKTHTIATYNMVDGNTPLSSFPMGKSVCLINGATGLSGIGTLETFKVDTGSYAFISYQIFTISTQRTIRFWDGTNNVWLSFNRLPYGQQGSAIADTSGATLATIETDLNSVKAILRTFGMISN